MHTVLHRKENSKCRYTTPRAANSEHDLTKHSETYVMEIANGDKPILLLEAHIDNGQSVHRRWRVHKRECSAHF